MRATPDLSSILAPVFLTKEDLAKRWGVSMDAIHQRKHRKTLPPNMMVGEIMYFPVPELEAWETRHHPAQWARWGL